MKDVQSSVYDKQLFPTSKMKTTRYNPRNMLEERKLWLRLPENGVKDMIRDKGACLPSISSLGPRAEWSSQL